MIIVFTDDDIYKSKHLEEFCDCGHYYEAHDDNSGCENCFCMGWYEFQVYLDSRD